MRRLVGRVVEAPAVDIVGADANAVDDGTSIVGHDCHLGRPAVNIMNGENKK